MKFDIPVELDRNEIIEVLTDCQSELPRFEILGIISLQGEHPEFDGYYTMTQLGNILKTQIEKQWCLVDGRLRKI